MQKDEVVWNLGFKRRYCQVFRKNKQKFRNTSNRTTETKKKQQKFFT